MCGCRGSFFSYEEIRQWGRRFYSILKLEISILCNLLMQPLVAVPSYICADAFNKFLPFATGFAAGCMIWMVMAEVLPDGFKVHIFECGRG